MLLNRVVVLSIAIFGFAFVTVPVQAAGMAGAVPEFYTTGSWLVSPVRALEDAPMHGADCVMANQYDNGFIVRFIGGGGQFYAMTVDFRQAAFQEGHSYNATLRLGHVYEGALVGAAHGGNILVFPFTEQQGLYEALRQATTMDLTVEGTPLRFSLLSISNGIQRLENCVNPPQNQAEMLPTHIMREAGAVKREPIDLLRGDFMPEEQGRFPSSKMGVEGVAPMAQEALEAREMEIQQQKTMMEAEAEPDDDSWHAVKVAKVSKTASARGDQGLTPEPPDFASDPMGGPMPIVPEGTMRVAGVSGPVGELNSEIWQAQAGDDIKIVLAGWAERAGVDLVWDSDREGKLSQDIFVTGTFADAAQMLISQNAESMGVRGSLQTGTEEIPLLAGYPAPAIQAVGLDDSDPAVVWSAEKGDDLQRTLSRWARRNQAKVIWDTKQVFNVKNTMNESGTYEEALQALLEQYDNDLLRPIGSLNIDPASGDKTLIISSTDRPQS